MPQRKEVRFTKTLNWAVAVALLVGAVMLSYVASVDSFTK